MLSKVKSCVLHGLEGNAVEVEVDLSRGLPNFIVVGLPDVSIKESKERVRTAIVNSGYDFPIKKVTVNLSPANLKKEGSQLDLPIAIALLAAMGEIKDYKRVTDLCILGELSLDGSINKIDGALPMVIAMNQLGYENFIVPSENKDECASIKDVSIYEFEKLDDIVKWLNGIFKREPYSGKKIIAEKSDLSVLDFSEVKGQKQVKRAAEIAAAGAHNLIMIGPPGSGKSMIAQRFPTILPSMTFEESLEVTKIYSVAGLLKNGQLIGDRQFRAPHHTISKTALIGGGIKPMPGEVSLAHLGVLFLDELPEFNRATLEALRQPLEDGSITINRMRGSYTYPCSEIMIAAANPCKCGYYGDPRHECTCTSAEIDRYISKLSGPFLDRMDLQVEVSGVDIGDLQKISEEESSKDIRNRVEAARKIQRKRYTKNNIYSNSELEGKNIEKYCVLESKAKKMLEIAFDKMKLSARGYHNILKISRTIADLDKSEYIKEVHIAEALQYRQLDRKYH